MYAWDTNCTRIQYMGTDTQYIVHNAFCIYLCAVVCASHRCSAENINYSFASLNYFKLSSCYWATQFKLNPNKWWAACWSSLWLSDCCLITWWCCPIAVDAALAARCHNATKYTTQFNLARAALSPNGTSRIYIYIWMHGIPAAGGLNDWILYT